MSERKPEADEPAGFLGRWSRRKTAARQGAVAPGLQAPGTAVPTSDALPSTAAGARAVPASARGDIAAAAAPAPQRDEQSAEPAPTLEEAAALTPGSEVSRFVAPGVDDGIKRVALKKLFADPHFNVMDGLDVYIDDYGKPDPIPDSMLRKMAQAAFLGLVDDDPGHAHAAAPSNDATAAGMPVAEHPPTHEDADLQLQPDDPAGSGGARPGAGPHAGRVG